MPEPKLVTFYGYKGGAGRSLLAANVASILALAGEKVLLVDWDLEAPGLGDFLDLQGNFIPEKWRLSRGLYELLASCADAPPGEDFADVIRQELDPKSDAPAINRIRFPAGFNPKGDGRLDLLGPGCQAGETFDFALSLMSAEWSRFFDTHGPGFRDAFRAVMRELTYDFVVIDTRTGMNLPALIVMRLLSDQAFFVSSLTLQALDGVHRMWELLDREDNWSEIPKPAKHLILARYTEKSATRASVRYLKERFPILKERFPIKTRYRLPFLKEIGDLEQLFIRRSSDMARKIFETEERSPRAPGSKLMKYRKSFWAICEQIRPGVSGEAWSKIASGLFTRNEGDSRRGSTASFGGGSLSAKDWQTEREIATRDPPMSAAVGPDGWVDKLLKAEVTGSPPVPSLISTATNWLDEANLIGRSAVRVYIANFLKENARKSLVAARGEAPDSDKSDELEIRMKELAKVLPRGVADRLFLQLENRNLKRMDYPAEPERPTDPKSPGPAATEDLPEPAPSLRTPVLFNALALYREAQNLRKGDDPREALGKLKEAAEAQSGVLQEHPDERTREEERDAVNARAIYILERAVSLNELCEWDSAIALLQDLLQSGWLYGSRGLGSRSEVARFDVLISLLSITIDQLTKEPEAPPFERALRLMPHFEELERALAADWLTPIERDNAGRQIADLRILDTRREPGAADAEVVHLLIERFRHEEAIAARVEVAGERTEGISRLAAQTQIATTCAMLARLSPDEQWSSRLEAVLEISRAAIEESLSNSGGPAPPVDLHAAGNLLLGIGRNEEALSLYQDALQLLGRRSDIESETSRAELLVACGLAESQLGRPDLAHDTWQSVLDQLTAKREFAPSSWEEMTQRLRALELPVDSRRARLLSRVRWWHSSFRYESGDYPAAWNELTDSRRVFSAIANDERASPAVRADTRNALDSMESWLAGTATALGMHEEADKLCQRWRMQLGRVFFREVDAGRRFARCELEFAYSAYGASSADAALTAIGRGKSLNRLAAARFGLGFARVQDELSMLELEIRSFRGEEIDRRELDKVLARQRDAGNAMLTAARSNSWHYRTLIELGVLFAQSSAILLRIGDVELAEKTAREVLERWLAWIPGVCRADRLAWLDKLALPARAVCEAVLGKIEQLDGRGVSAETYMSMAGRLSVPEQSRYARVLEYCSS